MGFGYSNKLFGGTGGGVQLPVSLENGGTGVDLSGVVKGDLIVGTGAGTVGLLNVGANGTVPSANNAVAGGIEWVAAPAAGAAGSDTEIQFNDGGASLGGATNFTYSKAAGVVTLTATSAAVPLTVRAYSSGTDAIAQFQDSSNNVLSTINHDGKYTLLADKGAGKVLTSDANGVGSWAAAAGGITNSAGANVVPKSDGTNLVASALSESSTGVFATSAGTALSFAATAPAATTGASQAGVGVTVTASPAVASTDTDGAAAGGSVTITAGAAARRTSGNANGGNINLVPGAGIGTGTAGSVVFPDGAAANPSVKFTSATGIYATSSPALGFSISGTNYASLTTTLFYAPAYSIGTGGDTLVRRRAAANPAWGAAAASPVAYTHNLAADARSGTDTNTAGANATLLPGIGTGTGAASRLLLGGPILGSTGSAAQSTATPVSIGGEVKADGTESFLNVTGTLPASPSATVYGVSVSVTGAGTASQNSGAVVISMPAGYTGSYATRSLLATNASAGTGTISNYGSVTSNTGAIAVANATTAGHNIGLFGQGSGSSTLNIGVLGSASYSGSSPGIGVVGQAPNGTGGLRVGGYFGLGSAVLTSASNIVAALVADNGASANPIFLAKDNGTTVFSINDGGGVNLMREVEANTAGSGTPNVLTADESHKVLTNEGSTAANYHTLPTAAKGLTYTFYVQDGDGIRITAGTGDTIRINTNVTAAAGYIESTTIGSSVTLVAINDTEWVAIAALGTWVV